MRVVSELSDEILQGIYQYCWSNLILVRESIISKINKNGNNFWRKQLKLLNFKKAQNYQKCFSLSIFWLMFLLKYWFLILNSYSNTDSRFQTLTQILVPDSKLLLTYWFPIPNSYSHTNSRFPTLTHILIPDSKLLFK